MRGRPLRQPISATLALVIANVAVYAVQMIAMAAPRSPLGALFAYLPLYPQDLAKGFLWQLLTFQFLHAGLFHILINCAMLYMFGRSVEMTLGRAAFLRLYLGSGAAGGLFQAVCSWVLPSHFGSGPVVGASAGVFGLIAAFSVMNREAYITALLAFIFPISIKAKYLLAVMFVVAVLGMLEPHSHIAHAAHLGGMIGGIFLTGLLTKAGSRLWPWRWPKVRIVKKPAALVHSAGGAGGGWSVNGPEEEDLPTEEFIRREVDPILDKICAHGIQSLTERERRILELARKKFRGR